jgi:hypothetical protein
MQQLFTNKNDNNKNININILNINHQELSHQQIRINQQLVDQKRFYDQNILRERQRLHSEQRLFSQQLLSYQNVTSNNNILSEYSIVHQCMQDQMKQRSIQQQNEQKLLSRRYKWQILGKQLEQERIQQKQQQQLEQERIEFRRRLELQKQQIERDLMSLPYIRPFEDDDAITIITDDDEFLSDNQNISPIYLGNDIVVHDDDNNFNSNNKMLKTLFNNKNYGKIVEKLDIQIKNRDFVNSDDKCCICLDSDYNFMSSCKHSYCLDCFLVWKIDHSKNTCAYCKQILNTKESVYCMPFVNKN